MDQHAFEGSVKRCTRCGATKPPTEFYKKGDRLESFCKDCKREKRRLDYRFKLTEKDKRRWAKVMNMVLDFHIARQGMLLAEMDALIEKARVRERGSA